jgi:hypothetical protein
LNGNHRDGTASSDAQQPTSCLWMVWRAPKALL